MMAEELKRKNLGRGLSALFDEGQGTGEHEAPSAESGGTGAGRHSVPIEFLKPGRYQPRHHMDAGEIDELAKSIREHGILQPILVRPDPDDDEMYEIIAGERRWRAAQKAQLHEIPIIVREFSDVEALEVALVENLQREDLSPIEEAEGYDRLMREFNHTQEDLAKILGKSRSHLANTVRLINLPDSVKRLVDAGDISAGHARALLNADDPIKTANSVVRRGLNVRQTERLVQRKKSSPRKSQSGPTKDSDTLALEHDVSQLVGLNVDITFTDPGGSVTVHYDSLEQLDDILHRLTEGARGKIAPGPSGGGDEDPFPKSADAAIAELEAGAVAEEPAGGSAGSGLDFDLNEREIAQLLARE